MSFGTAGTKPITATYSGDANYTPSAGSANHTVSKAPSVTTFGAVAPEPSTSNQLVNVAVSVTGAGATATGTVAISLSGGQTSTCTVTLASGIGNCNVVFTAAGTYTITAIYSGDGTHYPSSNSTYSHVVN
jgi:hypothetical protein